MPDFAELFADNPSYFLMLFGGVLALFLMVFIGIRITSANKKKLLRGRGDLAELIFDQTVRVASQFVTDIQFMGYKIFSVNGVEPLVVSKSIFVPTGTCRIELQYIDTDYATRKRSLTTVYEKQLLEFEVHSNKSYRITFDENNNSFSVQ